MENKNQKFSDKYSASFPKKKPIVLYTGNVGKNGGFTEACFQKNESGNKSAWR
ncbi:hypothetical protein [Enterococcus sp. AZ191]|uniref:hypothetical protein n=1 Tax=Enterococcus sp. AZ191 TaxID=2774639 RepID=UPI003F683D04